MERVDSYQDEMTGVVRYRLSDGRMVCFDARSVREHGVAALMEAAGFDEAMPTARVDVYQNGRKVGTVPPDFDPYTIRSRSFLYDPRPGDFVREGRHWKASRTLGPGDLGAVPGFHRER